MPRQRQRMQLQALAAEHRCRRLGARMRWCCGDLKSQAQRLHQRNPRQPLKELLSDFAALVPKNKVSAGDEA